MSRRLLSSFLALVALVSVSTVAAPAGASESDGFSADPQTAIADIQSFWAKALPDTYGIDYESIPTSRQFAYSADDPPPACGGSGTAPYEEVKGNAFYCSDGDFVAWDAQALTPQLEHDFGRFAVALVLAHEWGHAIQARVDSTLGAGVYIELQADCFAGAWAHAATLEDGGPTHAARSDLEGALGGYLQFRDPPGIDPGQQGAHGNAFDRVTAFQDGYANSTQRCQSYEDEPPVVTEDAYRTYEDQANGGDLPLDEVEPLVRKALDDYWDGVTGGRATVSDVAATSGTPSCSNSDGGVLDHNVVFCPSGDRIEYNPAFVERAYDEAGDMGSGMLVAAAWSSAVQHALGVPIGTKAAKVGADCLTGAWAGAVWRGEGTSQENAISLSPGDLDEAVRAFVSFGADGDTTAFERVQSFGRGFTDGPGACNGKLGD